MPSLNHGDYRIVSHTKHFGVGPKVEARDGHDLQMKQSTRATFEEFPCVDFNELKKNPFSLAFSKFSKEVGVHFVNSGSVVPKSLPSYGDCQSRPVRYT